MGLDLIFKIAGIGIIVAVLNPILTKAGRDEQATLVTLADVGHFRGDQRPFRYIEVLIWITA